MSGSCFSIWVSLGCFSPHWQVVVARPRALRDAADRSKLRRGCWCSYVCPGASSSFFQKVVKIWFHNNKPFQFLLTASFKKLMMPLIGPPLLIYSTEVVLLFTVLDSVCCAGYFWPFLLSLGGRVVLERPRCTRVVGGVSKHEPSLSRPSHRPCCVTK